jgi:unsaturated rhamnogalacturonyl hydrolase
MPDGAGGTASTSGGAPGMADAGVTDDGTPGNRTETGAGGEGSGQGDSSLADATVDEPGPASQLGFDWGKAVIDTRLAANATFNGSYQDGLALRSIYKAAQRLDSQAYRDVVTRAAKSYGAPPGSSLDEMMHMAAVVDAFELTRDQTYAAPAQTTRRRFDTYPKADGVFWHANNGSRDHQLWADGTFMSLAFLTRYGSVFDDASIWSIAVTQLVNTAKHLRNPVNGLLWHAWDESKTVAWSMHPSQTNEIHWGRAMGWFAVASVITLEALPLGNPGRTDVERELKGLVETLAGYQDPTTGRWYQVVNLQNDSRNWLETSCSAMFSYATWWAYKHHLVSASFGETAKRGFAGVMQRIRKDANDRTTIEETCTGLNASDDLVGNYLNHPRADNDPHGIGAFLMMWEGMQ